MRYSGYVYYCSAGETFDSIALATLGDEKYACELMNANPGISNVSVFSGGEVILMPEIEVTEGEYTPAPSNAPWKEA
ncbi:MAG: tail protein X [Eubacteriales bacterium]|nr:tail protein X [Eubacteriales bacterium]MDD4512868.1 tail protein X [Eubacteriales bacterium]